MARKAGIIARPPILSLPEHEVADIFALKAIQGGTADAIQQQRFMEWLLKKVCTIGGISYHPDNETATNFNEGRRYVGVTLMHFIQEPMNDVRTRLGTPKSQGEQS